MPYPSTKPTPGDRAAIDWLMQRVHVGTSEADIRADIMRRCRASDFGYPDGYAEACADYAVHVHKQNRALYARVTGGM